MYGVENITEVIRFPEREIELEPTVIDTRAEFQEYTHFDLDFSDVKGQGECQEGWVSIWRT